MTTEYRIEMFHNGEWIRAQRPYLGNESQHIKTLDEAKYRMFMLQNKWAVAWVRLSDEKKADPKNQKPTAWRIVKRNISDWEVC